MNYEKEKKVYTSFCGSYCHTCDWFTGEIRRTFQSALDAVELYGFRKLLEGRADVESLKSGLEILAGSGICPGCKPEAEEKPDDRCKIRQCCFKKGLDLCSECPDFPCEVLRSNPGVIKFGCIDNLNEIQEKGFEVWVERKWKEHISSQK